jgi:hypothetical protein
LAKQIRETAFEALDGILVDYVNALNQIHVDLKDAASNFSDSSILGEALKAAAIGRVAGGFGGSGKLLGTVGAIAAVGKEAMKQRALVAQQKQLEAQAKSLAFSKILEYLKAVEALPENLLDYGCAKCFGAHPSDLEPGLGHPELNAGPGSDGHPGHNLWKQSPFADRQFRWRARREKQGQCGAFAGFLSIFSMLIAFLLIALARR